MPTKEELDLMMIAVKHLKTAACVLQMNALRMFEIAVEQDMDNRVLATLADIADDLDPDNYPYMAFKAPPQQTPEVLGAGVVDILDYHILSGMVREWRKTGRVSESKREGEKPEL